jgi:hypothetical protein
VLGEGAREAALAALLRPAAQHAANSLARRMLGAWRQHVASRPRPQRALLQLADALQRRQLLVRSWATWLGASLEHRRLRAGRRLAHRCWLRRLLLTWRRQAAGRGAVLEEVRQRFLAVQRQALARVLARWRLHLRLQQRKQAALEVAGAHWAQMLLRRSVCGWADVAQHCRQLRVQAAVQAHLQVMQVGGGVWCWTGSVPGLVALCAAAAARCRLCTCACS